MSVRIEKGNTVDFTGEKWPETDCTDVHLGLIPLDPRRNADHIESRYVQHATPSQNLGVFTNGDSWVEWGERRTYEPDYNQHGRMYGAPGLHVAVRFPPLGPLPEPTRMEPAEYHRWKRTQHLAGLAKEVIAEVFTDLILQGYRISDYACITDATDWSQVPTWDPASDPDTGDYGQSKVVTFYA